MGGGAVTEDFSVNFEGNRSSFVSVCAFPDGSKTTFEAKGKRVK